MWLLELMGFVLVVGSVVGLVWRYGEEWLDRRTGRKQLDAELMIGGTEQDNGTVGQPINIGTTVSVSTTKSN
jgi:hypothetical protein